MSKLVSTRHEISKTSGNGSNNCKADFIYEYLQSVSHKMMIMVSRTILLVFITTCLQKLAKGQGEKLLLINQLFNIYIVLLIDNIFDTFIFEDPNVMLALIVGKSPLFLPEFLQKVYDLDYPKDHLFIHVTIQNATKYHYVKEVMRKWKQEYRYVKKTPDYLFAFKKCIIFSPF